MFGRLLGLIVGAAIAVTGYGMLNPHPFAKYFDFGKLSLGPFAEYKTVVCWLIVALGAVVALASLQRPSGGGKKRVGPVVFAPSEPEVAHAAAPHAEPAHAPEAHDDHGHGHSDHGHDAHGHDDHGHDDHGHGHGHDDHGHGHDDHGHGHGHAHDHAHEPSH